MNRILVGVLGIAAVLGHSAAASAEEDSEDAAAFSATFVRIPRGTFQMGSPTSQPHFPTEVVHRVTLSRDFELQNTVVTQSQWFGVMGSNPSVFKSRAACGADFRRVDGVALCPNHPVENLTWNEAQSFIDKLNEANGLICQPFDTAVRTPGCYRLPTESEWEYAARAGTGTPYWFGSDVNQVQNYVWFLDNAGGHTRAVAGKPANPWNLYDMTGNVWQWVQDFFGPYPLSPVTDPQGPRTGAWRSFRGCSWNTERNGGSCPQPCRTAYRNFEDGGPRSSMVGFRLARSVL